MSSTTERCAVCGRAVARVGKAQRYVHANQFHVQLHHEARVQRTPMGYFKRPEPRAWEVDLTALEDVYADA